MGYVSLFRAINKALQPQKRTAAPKTQVYVAINGQQAGPFTKTELTQLVKNGTLTSQTMVWQTGMPAWAPATNVPEVHKLLLLHTPKSKTPIKAPIPQAQQPPEHPLRSDLISAMAQLGFKGADVTKSVDALLTEQPQITCADALKILLQKQ